MRKIFNILETTPEPCSDEKAAFEAAILVWEDALVYFLTIDSLNESKKAELTQIKGWVADMEAAVVNIGNRVAGTFQQIGMYQKGLPTANKYLKLSLEREITKLQNQIIRDNQIRDGYGKQISNLNKNIPDREAEIAQNEKNIKNQLAQVKSAETAMNAADIALNQCLNSPLYTRLNLKTSCIEIKQKIKTVNQKSISLNNKLINLNSGISSLNVLNINKNFFDKSIRITKEFIILLDKINPKLNHKPKTLDSSFSDLYRKAEEDLIYYSEERKISRSKIKIAEEKIINIPEKQNVLQDRISNTIQKFVNCKTPSII